MASFSDTPQHRVWHTKNFEFDTCNWELEIEVKRKQSTTITKNFLSKQLNVTANQIQNVAYCLCQGSANSGSRPKFAATFHNIGFCRMHSSNYFEALTFLKRALENYQDITFNAENDSNIATTLKIIEACHMHLCSCSNASAFKKREFKIDQNKTLNTNENSGITMKPSDIRLFFIRLYKYCVYNI